MEEKSFSEIQRENELLHEENEILLEKIIEQGRAIERLESGRLEEVVEDLPTDGEINQMIDYLVEQGALNLHGMTHDGDVTYTMNPEVLKEVLPELYELYMREVEESIVGLLQEGLVKVEYDESLTPWFSITEQGEEFLKNNGLFPL